jgi:hypothetical protein
VRPSRRRCRTLPAHECDRDRPPRALGGSAIGVLYAAEFPETSAGWCRKPPDIGSVSKDVPRCPVSLKLRILHLRVSRWTNPNGGQNGGQTHSKTKRRSLRLHVEERQHLGPAACPPHLPEQGGSERVHSRSRRRSPRLRAIYPGAPRRTLQSKPSHSGGTFTLRESSGRICAAYQNPPSCSFDCVVASPLRKRDTPYPGEQRSSRPGPTSPDDSPFETLLVFPPQH